MTASLVDVIYSPNILFKIWKLFYTFLKNVKVHLITLVTTYDFGLLGMVKTHLFWWSLATLLYFWVILQTMVASSSIHHVPTPSQRKPGVRFESWQQLLLLLFCFTVFELWISANLIWYWLLLITDYWFGVHTSLIDFMCIHMRK